MSKRPRYTLDELLAGSENGPPSAEVHEWMNAPAVGREILPPYDAVTVTTETDVSTDVRLDYPLPSGKA